jgi:hypothetical protein
MDKYVWEELKKKGSNKYEIGMIWYSVAKIYLVAVRMITQENIWFDT